MSYISVIGNGESRKNFDLYSLTFLGKTVGTNAVHRDFIPDYLVCADRRMVSEAVNNNYSNPVYTRSDWRASFSYWKNVLTVPDLPYKGDKRPDDSFQWGSGGHALNLACTFDPQFVVMIGFDLYSKDKLFNNIYKDTEHYNESRKDATDPSYWIYQTAKLFEHYPKVKFIQIQPDDWDSPTEWENFDNFFIDNYNGLEELIDKNK